MKTRPQIVCGGLAFSVVAALAFVATAAMAQNVGAAAAVQPTSTGTPPGGSQRTLATGTEIVSQERIQTSAGGSLQVMFLDQSTLTIGPNSDLQIDEFVYSPDSGTGEFAASLARGALRFVGGQISHTAGVTIDTPSATMGIRGGAGIVAHNPDCEEAIERDGELQVACTTFACTAGQCQVSLHGGRTIDLALNQGLSIGPLGEIQSLNLSAVSLNEVATLGTGGISATGEEEETSTEFQSQEAIDRLLAEQAPEPPAPPAPPP